MDFKKLKIIILATDTLSTRIIYNHINSYHEIDSVIIEKKISIKKMIVNRYKKVGLLKLIDQLLFLLLITKILKLFSKKRITDILNKNNLNSKVINSDKIINVKSANSLETINLLRDKNPDIIIINGTRILSNKFLNNILAKIINLHAGITPEYRGVHGAYWAFVNKNNALAGITLHFVDAGIDTGNIISQALININQEDNFLTYPLLQLNEGIKLLDEFLFNCTKGLITMPKKITNKDFSKQWFHPGFCEYIYYRIFYGIR
jgi:folate-dependent phosphoribosylglycinamide formyltransferase PurN